MKLPDIPLKWWKLGTAEAWLKTAGCSQFFYSEAEHSNWKNPKWFKTRVILVLLMGSKLNWKVPWSMAERWNVTDMNPI